MHLRILLASMWVALPTAQPQQPRLADRGDELALVGIWQLDLARTHYGPGVDRRRRERMRCAVRARLVDCTIESVRADGRQVTAHFSAPATGVPAAVSGLADLDTVRLEPAARGVVDATFSYRGRAAFGYRAYRSDDGESLTVVSVDPRTRVALGSVVVYRRVGTGRRVRPTTGTRRANPPATSS